jgi:hypothetical protein
MGAVVWIISLLAGAVGGNVFGKLFPKLSLGQVGNSLSGIVGGGAGQALLSALDLGGLGNVAANGVNVTAVLGSVLGGGVGGGLIMVIVGFLKTVLTKK